VERRWTILLNVFVPGVGLIPLRREWLGVAVALLFVLFIEVGLLGAFLIPAAFPTWLTVAAFIAGGALWIVAQCLCRRQWQQTCGPDARREVELLRRRAMEALAAGNLTEAGDYLQAALNINDEDIESNVLFAEVMQRLGRTRDAHRAARRARQLQPDAQQRRAIAEHYADLYGQGQPAPATPD